MLWESLKPITSDVGLTPLPTATFEDRPGLNVPCASGSPGQAAGKNGGDVMDLIARSSATLCYVTSAYAGSLIFAAASRLDGYRSACCWMSRDVLGYRNRIPSGCVTARVDPRSGFQPSLGGETLRTACGCC